MRSSEAESYGMRAFWSEAAGGFIAVFSEVPQISGFGATEEEALAELREVLRAVVEIYLEEGRPVTKPVAEAAAAE